MAGSHSRRPLLTGALATALVTLVYLLLFWNHFAGLRSGNGEFGGGSALLSGHLPYRDYFTASTPLTVLKSALVLKTFGGYWIVTRGFSVFERICLVLLIYFWLARLFRAHHAAIGATLAMIMGTGDIADPLASYNHDAITCAVAAGFVASFALDSGRSERWTAILGLLTGVFAGLAFATKQTTGLGSSVAIPVIVCACLLRLDGLRRAAIFLVGYVCGWAACAGLLLAWLAQLGILSNFFEQVFVRGPAAKASHPSDFFFRTVYILRRVWWASSAAVVLLAVCWTIWTRSARKEEDRNDDTRSSLLVLLAGAIAIALGVAVSYTSLGRAGRVVLKPTVYFTFFSVTLLPIFYGVLWLLGRLTRRQAQFCLYAAVSFAVAFMLSLSYPGFEAMIVPGLGLLIAALLDAATRWQRPLVYAASFFLIAGETCAKLAMPYGFEEFNEPPVRTANTRSSRPELKGFVLPEGIVQCLDGTLNIIGQHSRPEDTIFTYPEFGIFYSLSNRWYPTFTGSHNIDVVNDDFARNEAARLLSHPPAVLIYYREPASFLADEELLWRGGRRSGNRDIIAAVETLAAKYHLAATYPVPPDGRQINVYVRE